MDNTQLAKEIVAAVGGKENINSYEHCATRLRLMLKDFEKVDDEKVTDLDGVQGTNRANGQYQVILGPGKVNLVTSEVGKIVGDSAGDVKEEKAEGNVIQRGVKTLSDSGILIL